MLRISNEKPSYPHGLNGKVINFKKNYKHKNKL